MGVLYDVANYYAQFSSIRVITQVNSTISRPYHSYQSSNPATIHFRTIYRILAKQQPEMLTSSGTLKSVGASHCHSRVPHVSNNATANQSNGIVKETCEFINERIGSLSSRNVNDITAVHRSETQICSLSAVLSNSVDDESLLNTYIPGTNNDSDTDKESLYVSESKLKERIQTDHGFELNENFEPVMYGAGGYVKRMAARNAIACVNAMFETVKKSKKPCGKGMHTSDICDDTAPFSSSKHCTDACMSDLNQEVHASSGSHLRKRKHHENGQSIRKRRKLQMPKMGLLSQVSPRMQENIVSRESSPSSFSLNTVFSESDPESTETTESLTSETNHVDMEYCDNFPYNSLGILYNGDCIHSKTCFYPKTPNISATSRIIPTVVPTFKKDVLLLRKKNEQSDIKCQSVKGDNGWSRIGNPIKTITINLGKGKKVQRKYFIGISRKKKEVFSRDSILLKSGSKKGDIPFVAKISSIWQETGENVQGGLMVTVFWYYRRQDTDSTTTSQFAEMEIMASQHHDDISVACIDDKCYVLGFKEFCRFRATIERLPHIKSARKHQSVSKLKHHLSKASVQYHCMMQSEVYLCFRAYNHITGKIMKA